MKTTNGLKAALITCTLTVILAIIAFATLFGSVRQQVTTLCHDVEIIKTTITDSSRLNSALCERVASLEAEIRALEQTVRAVDHE
jgi:cell division protein FtsB